MPAPDSTATDAPPDRKPRDDEIDVHGLTHPGKVRRDNQDHFLICSLRKQVVARLTSLPDPDHLMADSERLASLFMVADGVGGAAKGEEASRVALEAAAGESHAELLRRGQENAEYRGMATTLTLYLGVWPRAYLLQVGDSRCYLLREGELSQVTRDQTMAQEMVDAGIMTPADVAGAALFLVSEDAGWITGVVFDVTGGGLVV